MALNDRLKLRSMVVAEKRTICVYVASEECAIRADGAECSTNIWAPRGRRTGDRYRVKEARHNGS